MDNEKILEQIIEYGSKAIIAILVFFVGKILIKFIMTLISKSMEKVELEKSLRGFINSITGIALNILLFVTVASTLGIAMTSFITILGAAGLAVGLALQGSLSNFAGGVLILFFKPFKVDDVIETGSYLGKVKEIQVLYTILDTLDNRRIIIPNGNLANNSIMNYSVNDKRRVDMTFSAGYEDDIDKVKSIIMNVINEDSRILKDPEPFVRLNEHGDSSLNYKVKVWCSSKDYWDIYFDMQEKVKKEFDKEDINIPYPQMDVSIKK